MFLLHPFQERHYLIPLSTCSGKPLTSSWYQPLCLEVWRTLCIISFKIIFHAVPVVFSQLLFWSLLLLCFPIFCLTIHSLGLLYLCRIMTQHPKPCFPLISSWSFPPLVKWVYCTRDTFKPYIKSIGVIYERVDVQYYLLRNDHHPP